MKDKRFLASWIALLIVVCTLGIFLYFASNKYEDKQIRISTNPWVGFTPFIYAQEKGWINEKKFKFLWQVDLTENGNLYSRGLTQGFTATQYDLNHIKNNDFIKPLFLIDRSLGADAIVSNLTLTEIKNKTNSIDVFLEMGSVNEDLFKAFVKQQSLEKTNFNFINADQQLISKLQNTNKPFIAVTYSPYINNFTNGGFNILGDTGSMPDFKVIDGLYMDMRYLNGREKEFSELIHIFKTAQKVLKTNPEEFYSVVKNYLEGQSYEEFIDATNKIDWVNTTNREEIIRILKSQNLSTDNLLQ